MDICGLSVFSADDLGVYVNQAAFIVCAALGGIAHYLKKVAKKETTATFKGWFGKNNYAATIYTLLVFSFVIIGALAGDIINSQTGFWASLYTGFATGFAVDAGFNSDSGISLTRQIADVKSETGELFTKTVSKKVSLSSAREVAKSEPVTVSSADSDMRTVSDPTTYTIDTKMKLKRVII